MPYLSYSIVSPDSGEKRLDMYFHTLLRDLMNAQIADRFNALGAPLDAPQGTPQGAPSCAPLDAPQGTPQGASSWRFIRAPQLAIPHNLPPYYLHDFGEPPSLHFIIAFLCAERYKEMQARKTRTKVEVLSALSLAIYRQQDAPTAPTGLAGELCTLPIELIQIVAEKMMEKDRRDRADAGV